MKKIFLTFSLILALLLTACAGNNKNTDKQAKETETVEDNKIVVGVSPTPHGQIVEALYDEFKKVGLDVEVVNFDDYVQPNLQLQSGDLDANYFQHKPYFDAFVEERNIDNLINIASVHLEPIALYSKEFNKVEDITDNSEIIIPNDPANGARSLILLEKAGLIKLDDNTNLKATEKNIVENPKNLKITAMDAPSIAKVYEDAQAAIINSNYAIGAGLDPVNDSIFIEDKDSPYANLITIRKEDEGKEKFKKFVEVLNSEASRKYIEETFKGSVIPSF